MSMLLLRSTGEPVGYGEVDRLASFSHIHIRVCYCHHLLLSVDGFLFLTILPIQTGCFCNAGACQQNLGQSDEDVCSIVSPLS